jgi:hypothetical protein
VAHQDDVSRLAQDDVYRSIDEIAKAMSDDGNGKGFQRAAVISGSSYRDSSTVVIVPTREPRIHYRVVSAWQGLIAPMNQKRMFLYIVGDEVGIAYTNTIKGLLEHPELKKWKYVMTLESDNLPPADAHIKLLETIEAGRYDGVSGIYFTKGDINMPMAYGDPDAFRRTGELEFRPRDVREAIAKGQVMEVNGIAMGCSLYRLDLFREVPAPWFVTVNDVIEGKGPMAFTQDLYFCKAAKERGKRFAVDFRVRVGHLDLNTGEVY